MTFKNGWWLILFREQLWKLNPEMLEFIIFHCNSSPTSERRWSSGEHSCLPSIWPGFDSQPTQRTFLALFREQLRKLKPEMLEFIIFHCNWSRTSERRWLLLLLSLLIFPYYYCYHRYYYFFFSNWLFLAQKCDKDLRKCRHFFPV